jgi:hypothetical protein
MEWSQEVFGFEVLVQGKTGVDEAVGGARIYKSANVLEAIGQKSDRVQMDY